MADVGGKEATIGILIIAVVVLAGFTGFMMINPQIEDSEDCKDCKECEDTTTEPTFLYGLPDDWSTAPNSSSIIVYNTTDTVTIKMEEILDYVARGMELSEHENEWEDRLELYTVKDTQSGLWITGVDVLEVMDIFGTRFAGELEFVSHKDSFDQRETLNTSAYAITAKFYEEEEPVILGLAANKTWLAESPIGDTCGNFSIFGKNMEVSCKNLEYVNVKSNWTIKVYVNGVLNLTLSPYNLTRLNSPRLTVKNYSYIDTGYYNYNRTYWGVNLSDIVEYTGADVHDFAVRVVASDGWKAPHPYKEIPYNKTEVMEHLANNGTNIVGNHVDYVNGTEKNDDVYGVPMPATDLRMCLVFADRELGEGVYADPDPKWPYRKYLGYSGGPYQLVVPGRIKANYLSYIESIEITY